MREARMAVYWSKVERGVFGLASAGPTAGCRIGPAADIAVSGVHAVLDVTKGAVKHWELEPWG